MNRFFAAALAGLGWLVAGAALGNDILVYKFASTRPWTQYDCYRPDSTSPTAPPVPLTTVAGTYTLTEYWVIDQTASPALLQRVSYYSYVNNGVTLKQYLTYPKVKLYSVVSVSPSDPHVLLLQYLKANGSQSENACIRFGTQTVDTQTDLNGDGVADSQQVSDELNLSGSSKAYAVMPGLTLQHVATTLTGSYVSAKTTVTTNHSETTYLRRLAYENGTATLTLDPACTKNANTGPNLAPLGGGTGTTLTKATLDYGVRVAQTALESLGYDSFYGPN